MAQPKRFTLTLLEDRLAILRLNPGDPLPDWALRSPGFFSITRTSDECSIVCRIQHIPEGQKCEPGWRALKFTGPFDFTEVGVLASAAVPLAQTGIALLAISTFDTDYILIKGEHMHEAIACLRQHGFTVMIA